MELTYKGEYQFTVVFLTVTVQTFSFPWKEIRKKRGKEDGGKD